MRCRKISLEVLQNALRELLSVAEPAAAVSDVLDWATNHGAIFELDTDAVQRVLVKTRETKPALGITWSAPPEVDSFMRRF